MTKKELLMIAAVGACVGIVAVPVSKLLGVGGLPVQLTVGAVSTVIAFVLLARRRAREKE